MGLFLVWFFPFFIVRCAVHAVKITVFESDQKRAHRRLEWSGLSHRSFALRLTLRHSAQHARPGEKNFLRRVRLQLCVLCGAKTDRGADECGRGEEGGDLLL